MTKYSALFTLVLLIGTCGFAQVRYQQMGNTIYGSDGTR